MPQPKKSGSSAGARGPATPDEDEAEHREDQLLVALGALRELIGKGVVISAERLQETVDETVRRGRMTAQDAEELVTNLLEIGRRQAHDQALWAVDRVRRAAGLGQSFPIGGYDDLTAAQVQERLGALDDAQLRAVREHERRNANRKSVLAAIEKQLG